MRRINTLIGTLAILFLGGATLGAASPDRKFVGPEKCKICHKIQYASWSVTKHAKAIQALKPEEQKDAKCFGCHVTNSDASMPGVQCEQCHGAGGEYQGLKVMKDHAASVAAGLLLPTKDDCVKCHNSKSPQFKGFNFDEAAKKVHEHKPKT